MILLAILHPYLRSTNKVYFSISCKKILNMIPRRGFSSIFHEYMAQTPQASCESDDADRESLHIEDCSDSDEDNSHLNKSVVVFTPAGKRSGPRRQQSRSAKRKPLPIIRTKRKPLQDALQQSPRKVLGLVNSLERLDTLSSWNGDALHIQDAHQNVFSPAQKRAGEVHTHVSDDLNETKIEWSSSDSSATNSPRKSQIIENASSQQLHVPTDLDLLIELIERDNVKKAEQELKTKSKSTTKRCRKGSYESKLNRALQIANADHKFLKHDKRFGIKSGVKLRVVQLEQSFGVHLATVQRHEDQCQAPMFAIVLDEIMARHVKVDSQLEAFFEITKENGFEVEGKGTVFLRPNKILLL